jgi:periodic tryptophan protein 2
MTCLDYSHDGQFIATGGDDGKVKLWNTQSGFCFVTFTEHSASVKALVFARKKQIVFSASLDGTVRAFDLVRYRNFRTFTSPTPEHFGVVAVDTSGEIVVAASVENYDIYVWSVQNGQLLEILSGHEAPVSCLAFSPATDQLVSGSWDKSVRIWDIFARDNSAETIEHTSEVLAVGFSPDGATLASSTLDGNLNFWNMDSSKQIATIEGRKDISGGRSSRDAVTAANAGAGKSFTSLSFSSDGKGIIAGGNSKYVCLYDIGSKSLLKKFQVSHNLSLDRMQEMLNSKNMTSAGPKDLIDDAGENSDLEDRIDKTLPGVQSGDASLRTTKPEARTFQLKFSPTGRSWAAASTQGLLIYSVEDAIHFDPFDLDMDVTPDAVLSYLSQQEYSKALLCAFRLGELPMMDQVYSTIPHQHIALVIRDIGSKYFERFLKMILRQLDTSPRLEFHMEWTRQFFKLNTRFLKERSLQYRPILRALHKSMNTFHSDLSNL